MATLVAKLSRDRAQHRAHRAESGHQHTRAEFVRTEDEADAEFLPPRPPSVDSWIGESSGSVPLLDSYFVGNNEDKAKKRAQSAGSSRTTRWGAPQWKLAIGLGKRSSVVSPLLAQADDKADSVSERSGASKLMPQDLKIPGRHNNIRL